MKLQTIRFDLLILIMNIASSLFGQSLNIEQGMDSHENEMIEDYTRKTEHQFDFSDIFSDDLFEAGKIINVNIADDNELKKLHLNEIQIDNLKAFISENGELMSRYELNLIEGFDSTLILKIEPYISFESKNEPYPLKVSNLLHESRNKLFIKQQRVLETQNGYLSSDVTNDGNEKADGYIGSCDKILLKYNWNYHDRITFGLTMEKDAGESMKHGFDYNSFHLFYKSSGFIRRLLVGNFNAAFGLGLTMLTGFRPNIDPLKGTYQQHVNLLSPSSSVNEGIGLSGVGITISPFKFTEASLFFSYRKLDSRFDPENDSIDDGPNNQAYANTVIETGLHRTADEISNKGILRQIVYGGNINTQLKYLHIGTTITVNRTEDVRDIEYNPYRIINFVTKPIICYGNDISFNYRSFSLFSEYSQNTENGKALISGAGINCQGDYGLTIFYRNYSHENFNYFSNGYSQNSDCSNERGFYSSIYIRTHKNHILSAGADIYEFPWLKYRVDAPSSGSEYFIRSEFKFYDGSQLITRYTLKQSMLNPPVEANQKTIYPSELTNEHLRLEYKYNLTEELSLRNRIDLTIHKKEELLSTGFMMLQDVIYGRKGANYKLYFRYAIFDTDGYDNRIYAYENDLHYAYSVPCFSGNGSRLYTMLKIKLMQYSDFGIKYSVSFYNDSNTTGSGPEMSDGNTRSELKIELMVKF